MDRGFRAIFLPRSRSYGGRFSADLRSVMWNAKPRLCQEEEKFASLPAALIGRGAADGVHILDVADVGCADHPRLLHPVAEVLGAHEPAGVFDAVPID